MQKNLSTLQEELFIETFIIKAQQERMRILIKSKKGRKKLRETLAHTIKFNSTYIKKIPTNKQTTNNILQLLTKNSANKQCYLISEHTALDNKEMKLEEAINTIVGSGIATIVLCIPGKLAYYEGEDQNNRFILQAI